MVFGYTFPEERKPLVRVLQRNLHNQWSGLEDKELETPKINYQLKNFCYKTKFFYKIRYRKRCSFTKKSVLFQEPKERITYFMKLKNGDYLLIFNHSNHIKIYDKNFNQIMDKDLQNNTTEKYGMYHCAVELSNRIIIFVTHYQLLFYKIDNFDFIDFINFDEYICFLQGRIIYKSVFPVNNELFLVINDQGINSYDLKTKEETGYLIKERAQFSQLIKINHNEILCTSYQFGVNYVFNIPSKTLTYRPFDIINEEFDNYRYFSKIILTNNRKLLCNVSIDKIYLIDSNTFKTEKIYDKIYDTIYGPLIIPEPSCFCMDTFELHSLPDIESLKKAYMEIAKFEYNTEDLIPYSFFQLTDNRVLARAPFGFLIFNLETEQKELIAYDPVIGNPYIPSNYINDSLFLYFSSNGQIIAIE